MNIKGIVTTATLAIAGWLVVAVALPRIAAAQSSPLRPGYVLAENDHDHDANMHHDHDRDRDHRDADDWYQGGRGRWQQNGNQWSWRNESRDQWYQGQPGHWYQENNGWQFGSAGTVCNNAGRNCRVGGFIPANGEGMVSRTNPSMFWQCDSHGHNCHWARRPG